MNTQRIFVSTVCLPGMQHIESRLSIYRDYGLSSIELGAGVFLEDDSTLSRLPQMDSKFLIHNYFPPPLESFVLNLASVDAGILRRSIEFVCHAIELCARLGIPFYSVHAGFITDPTGLGPNSFIFPMPDSPDQGKKALDRFISSIEICVTHARRFGIQVLVENNVCSPESRGKLLLQTADEFMSVFRVLSSPYLGLLLDTGHLKVSARTFGFDKVAFVNDLASFVRALHIHDNDGTTDTHLPIQAGSWVLDILRKAEFTGLPVIIEAKFRHVKSLRQHVDWLKREVC